MKPVLAAAICLMLGSSSFSSHSAAKPVHPIIGHSMSRPGGETIPMLTGLGATLALVVVK